MRCSINIIFKMNGFVGAVSLIFAIIAITTTTTVVAIVSDDRIDPATITSETFSMPLRPCTLRCENRGYCEFVAGNTTSYAFKVQSGHLIQRCVCQPGYAGLACDVEVPECSISNSNQKSKSSTQRKCFNGAPCIQKKNGDWGCDCRIADKISNFAGHMCRNPYTEYCGGGYNPDGPLTFCTNGGKCKSAFMAARVSPGNLTVNLAYQHLGCVCNDAFYGPHCEFMRLPGDKAVDDDFQNSSNNQTPSETKKPVLGEKDLSHSSSMKPFTSFVISMVCLGVVLLSVLIIFQQRRRRRRRLSSTYGGSGTFVDSRDSPNNKHTVQFSALKSDVDDNDHYGFGNGIDKEVGDQNNTLETFGEANTNQDTGILMQDVGAQFTPYRDNLYAVDIVPVSANNDNLSVPLTSNHVLL